MKVTSYAFLLPLVFLVVSCSADVDPETVISQPPGTTNPTPSEPDPTNQVYTYDADETQIAALVNSHRASLGLGTLELFDFISSTCEDHNSYMIANVDMNHDGFAERAALLQDVLGATGISENVAFGYQSGQGAFDGWLNSPGHRAAIEGSATHFGISVSSDADGRKYYTAIFVYIDSGPL
ncbi:MAG: CAP domain-containing protein [Flavobacterium sp.]|uniref:CAP domain-containing protein n=1 Tax=Flavobacterium sp. TaxID=239 RepID=UPI00120E8049|nr:CAP domain-containing protein [Flavobacterium sp.]RZJ63255.1 MAG: CAP domain-containing protein [Flavobacterium sp.]